MRSIISRLIKHVLIYFFVSLPKKNTHKSILLIRLDAIGDYILFRNYIEIIIKSDEFKGYKITLVGNHIWKILSEELDSDWIDNFIWVDNNKFNSSIFYKCKKLREISSKKYDVVINPVYSREFYIGDSIVKYVHSNNKIGSDSDLSNITLSNKTISDKYYTKLIPTNNKVIFEFYRNKLFFESFLNTKIDIVKPIINHEGFKPIKDMPEKYALVFIGANAEYRKWNIENFVKVSQIIHSKYNLKIVLCGASSEIEIANNFHDLFKEKYINLVSSTTLIELLYVIHKAKLIISNETSVPHFAVALDVKNIFVISNGNHYGRFNPYPKIMSNQYYIIYPPKIEKELNSYNNLTENYNYGSNLDINDIEVESVIEKIDRNFY